LRFELSILDQRADALCDAIADALCDAVPVDIDPTTPALVEHLSYDHRHLSPLHFGE
jgi:hypothetical protein